MAGARRERVLGKESVDIGMLTPVDAFVGSPPEPAGATVAILELFSGRRIHYDGHQTISTIRISMSVLMLLVTDTVVPLMMPQNTSRIVRA